MLVQAFLSILLLPFNLEAMIKFAIVNMLSYMPSSLSAFKLLPKTRFIEARLLPVITLIISLLLLMSAIDHLIFSSLREVNETFDDKNSILTAIGYLDVVYPTKASEIVEEIEEKLGEFFIF